MVNVKKASGKFEAYKPQKVRNVLRNVGADEELSKEITRYVDSKLYEGISTGEIYKHVFDKLDSLEPPIASRYSLKRAITELGPTGYPFEKFVAGILSKIGYTTQTNIFMNGKCVKHEVDVLAEDKESLIIIETKFHTTRGGVIGIQTTLYVRSRFFDLKSQINRSDKKILGWLVTNTRFSQDSLNYAKCENLKLLGWDYPKDSGLKTLIDKSGLHPVTAIQSLDIHAKKQLLYNNMVFCKDVARSNKKELDKLLPNTDTNALVTAAKEICFIN